MRLETKQLIDRLTRAEWFSQVGEPLVEAAERVVCVESWDEAMNLCSSVDKENYWLGRSNVLTMHLHCHARQAYRRWNEIADAVKAKAEPLVSGKVRSVIEAHWLPKAFDDSVRWDIIHACMELEYADARPPTFFLSLAGWYERGRFPCAWGRRGAKGRIKQVEVKPDLDPDDSQYFERVLFFPTRETPTVLPEGELVVF